MMRRISGFAAVLLLTMIGTLEAGDEFVLFPVSGPDTPGAFGSVWATEHFVRNDGTEDAFIVLSYCQVSDCGLRLRPDLTYRISPGSQAGAYVVMSVPQGDVSKLVVSTIVRDVSRSLEPWGTSLPVAQELDFKPEVEVLNVPNNEAFRLTLRVFSLPFLYDFGPETRTFVIRVFAMQANSQNGNPPIVTDTLLTERRETVQGSRLVLTDPLLGILAEAGDRLRFEVTEASGKPVWGFVSATNNQTQHVTIFESRWITALTP